MFPEIYFISALDYCKDMIVSLISKITRAFNQACISGEGPEILKWERGGGGYVDEHGWPTKKILGFRWSEKVKITLETIIFWGKYFFQYF